MPRVIRSVFIIFLLLAGKSFAQEISKKYHELTKIAYARYKLSDFKNAGLAFSSAFKFFGGKGLVEDRYYAARCWALANEADSAFAQLYRITEKVYYSNYDQLITDKEFDNLHADVRWGKLLTMVKENKAFNFAKLITNNIHFIHYVDQPYPINKK